MIATADRAALERRAPEAFQARGPWAAFEIVDLDGDEALFNTKDTKDTSEQPEVTSASFVSLVSCCTRDQSPRAARSPSHPPANACALCREAAALDAETCGGAARARGRLPRERRRRRRARRARSRRGARARLGSGAYEGGKLWLGLRRHGAGARDAFQRAADLMPTFSAAFSNLGATLGELDRPEAALARVPPGARARSARLHNPEQHRRRRARARTARRIGGGVPARDRRSHPAFVFGYYNLGHTLFLAGPATPTRSPPTKRDSGAIRSRTGARDAASRWRGSPPATSTAPAAICWRCAERGARRRARGSAARSVRDRARADRAASGAAPRSTAFVDAIASAIPKSRNPQLNGVS